MIGAGAGCPCLLQTYCTLKVRERSLLWLLRLGLGLLLGPQGPHVSARERQGSVGGSGVQRWVAADLPPCVAVDHDLGLGRLDLRRVVHGAQPEGVRGSASVDHGKPDEAAQHHAHRGEALGRRHVSSCSSCCCCFCCCCLRRLSAPDTSGAEGWPVDGAGAGSAAAAG